MREPSPRGFAARILRALESRSYVLARYSGLANARRAADARKGTPPVLVYQMGKVGSTTLLGALGANWPGMVYHLHTLRREHLRKEEAVFRRLFARRRRIPLYVIEGLYLVDRLDPDSSRRWTVVTLVRDPVARNVATFFQTLDAHHTGAGDQAARSITDESMRELQRHFVERFEHDSALTWFDRELKHVFGVDVLSEQWQHGSGYRVYESARARVLLLRLEDLDRVGTTALAQFLGRTGFSLPRRNTGEQKSYSELYRRFKQTLALPEDLLERMYSSRLATRFFTAEELAKLRRSWSGDPRGGDGRGPLEPSGSQQAPV